MLEPTTNCTAFTPSDIRDAGADFLAKAMGANPVHPHPVSDQMRLRELTLAEAAYILGEPELKRRGASGKSASSIVAAGLTTDDFGSILEASVARLVAQAYRAAAEHRALLHPYPLPNYHPAEIATVDVDVDVGEVTELQELPLVQVDVGAGNVAQVQAYAANLVVSYKLVVNDDLDALTTMARAMAVSAARREARVLYEFLEGNPTMGDGQAMFHADHGNLLSGIGALGPATLGTAMAALRDQQTPGGQYANHGLETLLVNSADEQVARQVVRDTGSEARVIAAPWIGSGNFYAMAAPATAPTIAMVYLGPRGDTAMQTVRVSRRPPDRTHRRTGVEIAHDFGFAPVSRVGIVKATN
ncbi:hypothetical protein H0Z60_04920 [Ectothiorhodospiraceae bacterium WFHF3C12]|nr:hypothetical protein [Ectothiorhodospiraceae bacterium WFHF3C12]